MNGRGGGADRPNTADTPAAVTAVDDSRLADQPGGVPRAGARSAHSGKTMIPNLFAHQKRQKEAMVRVFAAVGRWVTCRCVAHVVSLLEAAASTTLGVMCSLLCTLQI